MAVLAFVCASSCSQTRVMPREVQTGAACGVHKTDPNSVFFFPARHTLYFYMRLETNTYFGYIHIFSRRDADSYFLVGSNIRGQNIRGGVRG